MDFNSTKMITFLRALIPCVDYKERQFLTLIILLTQLKELMLTLDDMQSGVLEALPVPEHTDEKMFLHALESVCSPEELHAFSKYKQMFRAFQMMQAMEGDAGTEPPPSPNSPNPSGPPADKRSPLDFFQEMLSPEQRRMAEAILSGEK
ncbi:MAG: hypothetical protein IJV50_04610 [Lachnospiraceae bacterium]|nr:hypothetical protein [Lachnospiraceae bacterium]